MNRWKIASLALLLTAFSASAQRHHGGGGGRGGFGGGGGGRPPMAPPPAPATIGPVGPIGFGFGNVVFPGGGIPQATGHAANLGAAVRGVYAGPSYGGGGYGYGYGRGGGGAIPIAVPVPVYVGGYGYGYGGGYAGYAPQQQPSVTVVNAPPETPTVIINQNYTPERPQPVMREYPDGGGNSGTGGLSSYQAPVPSNPEPPRRQQQQQQQPSVSNEDTPTVYLIALRDGTVYSAYAYWVEGDTLHYITTKHSHNRASVSLVDDTLSEQLNRERNVEWKLKGAH